MDKRRAQRRQRVANKVGNLAAAAVGRAEAARVVGGEEEVDGTAEDDDLHDLHPQRHDDQQLTSLSG